MSRRRVAVVGGGIGGATAALHLARSGHDVVLVERSPALGGLVVSFSVSGTPLECFYHHVFPHERHVLGLIDELGLTPRLEWFPSSMAVFTAGTVWPFTSPLDLLRFRPLPLADRLRTGAGALRLARVREWEPLDALPAREWLRRYTGERAAEVVWDPLLAAKFGPAAGDVPAAWMWGRFRQRAGARRRGGERLGYLRGGFRQLFAALEAELTRLGADIRTGVAARRIAVEGGAVAGVELDGEALEVDTVLYTGPSPGLPPLLPADAVDPRWAAVPGLGVLCVVLELDRPVGPAYWTNVCDPALPFGGVIEHTNLVPATDYGGRHVVYLSRYFTPEEPLAGADPATEAEGWVGALADRWPGFSPASVLAVHPFRAAYAAPLVRVGHLSRIAPLASHVRGLYVSTTAQIYPEDRGMSEGVRTGAEAAAAIVAASSSPRPGLVTGPPQG